MSESKAPSKCSKHNTSSESSHRKRKSSPRNEHRTSEKIKQQCDSETREEVKNELKSAKEIKPKAPKLIAKIGHLQNPKIPPKTGKQKITAATVFGGESSDDEGEEMPFEAKLRLKNVGKNTPTSAGPNSFGKISGKGFIDPRVQWKKVIEDTKKRTDQEEDNYKSICKAGNS